MKFLAEAQKSYSAAADQFDRAVLTRAFAILFFGLAVLITLAGVAGIAANHGLAFSPLAMPALMALILIAATLWFVAFILQTQRQAIENWFRVKPHNQHIEPLSTSDTSFSSAQLYSEVEPPRSTPRAKLEKNDR